MPQLFFTNVPYNCSDRELKEWIESNGAKVESVTIIRDLVTGVSPAFAYAGLEDTALLSEIAALLNGKKMRNHVLLVKQLQARRFDESPDHSTKH